MTEAIVRSVLSNGSMDPGVVWVHDRNEGRKEIFRGMGVRVPEQGCREMVEACDSVVLSVKPQVVDDALEEMDGLLEGNKLLFSVVAGLEISKLEEKFPKARIVRLMPNTPVSVGMGVVGYSTGRSASERDVKLTEEMFSAAGMMVRLKEQQLDALTGVSGSGPAYMFLALDALADGGVAEGLPRQVALRIAAQTMKGAAEMVLQGDGTDPNMHPAVLKDRVASPAGTTIEGLHALEREGVRTAFFQAVRSSANKSRALRGV